MTPKYAVGDVRFTERDGKVVMSVCRKVYFDSNSHVGDLHITFVWEDLGWLPLEPIDSEVIKGE